MKSSTGKDESDTVALHSPDDSEPGSELELHTGVLPCAQTITAGRQMGRLRECMLDESRLDRAIRSEIVSGGIYVFTKALLQNLTLTGGSGCGTLSSTKVMNISTQKTTDRHVGLVFSRVLHKSRLQQQHEHSKMRISCVESGLFQLPRTFSELVYTLVTEGKIGQRK